MKLAKREIRDGCSTIDMIGDLEDCGFSSREAEEIVEAAELELDNQ